MSEHTTRHAIRNRLLWSIAATVVLGLSMTAAFFFVASVTIRTLAERTTTMNAVDEAADTLASTLLSQERFILAFALSGRAEAVEEFDGATAEGAAAYATFRFLARDYPDLLARAEAVRTTSDAWREDWAKPLLRSVIATGGSGVVATVADGELLFLPAEDALEALEAEVADERTIVAAEAKDRGVALLATIIISVGLGTTVVLGLIGMSLMRSIGGPLRRLNQTAEALVAGEQVTFRAERDDELGALAEVLERLRIDAGQRYDVARREGEHAATFNQLAELTSFARDEAELVNAASRAIRRLVSTTAGDVLLVNPSQNRLTVGVAWGDGALEPGTLVALDRIDRCPGIRRSTTFVVADVTDDLAVRCPAHVAAAGTVACLPMLALGKIVGVIHLESNTGQPFAPDAIRLVARVAENVGLAMANARLMSTMEGQAMTDPLTGLRNTRFFDPYLEQELEAARRDQQPLSVVMVDIDHFKNFNDTHGHPAGDEALRTFARVLGGSIRASDVAARYGGEEFIIALRHAGIDEAQAIAEKLRLAVEQSVVELGPGRYARITASFGVASTGLHIQDQKTLVSLADAALYSAKELGRNRVELAPTAKDVVVLNAAGRRRHGTAAAKGREPLDQTAG
jgi:diguanylate cyclase (GGDEF)-like protein